MYLKVVILMVVSGVSADYDCVCNYKVEAEVYDHANTQGAAVGYLYEFDCKPLMNGLSQGNFYQIMYERKVGYLEKGDDVEVQICQGDLPSTDLVVTGAPQRTTEILTTEIATTTQSVLPTASSTRLVTTATTIPETTSPATTPTTTPTTIATTTPSPATTTMTTPTTAKTTHTTTTTTTPIPTTTAVPKTTLSTIIEGRTDLCPDHIRQTHYLHNHGQLGQYGKYCYELVANKSTQMITAERQCQLVPGGHLASIVNQEEQNYISRLLTNNKVTDPVWIGLTDSGTTGEGKWRWTSGEAYSFNNFGSGFAFHSEYTHKLDDCVIVKPGGEWTDAPCGVAFILGTGFGEMHPYICQYTINVTSLPTNSPLLGILVG